MIFRNSTDNKDRKENIQKALKENTRVCTSCVEKLEILNGKTLSVLTNK